MTRTKRVRAKGGGGGGRERERTDGILEHNKMRPQSEHRTLTSVWGAKASLMTSAPIAKDGFGELAAGELVPSPGDGMARASGVGNDR